MQYIYIYIYIYARAPFGARSSFVFSQNKRSKQKQKKQNKTKQNKTKQSKTKQNKTKQNKTRQTQQNKNITTQKKTLVPARMESFRNYRKYWFYCAKPYLLCKTAKNLQKTKKTKKTNKTIGLRSLGWEVWSKAKYWFY